MGLDITVRSMIKEEMSAGLAATLPMYISEIFEKIQRPEYLDWGRYLTTDQACTYMGCKSPNGLKSMLRCRGIQPIKISEKNVKYDRHELDKINVLKTVEDYFKTY